MSATAVRSEYASLLTSNLPAVIRSEAENERHIALLEELDRKGNRMSAAERRMAELLRLLIEDFEEKHYVLKSASPIEVLNELMLANDLKQKDLMDVFGTPSIASEVLNGKRKCGAHSQAEPSLQGVTRGLLLIHTSCPNGI